MAGAAKKRANREREQHTFSARNGSSSGETSSSGKNTRSAHSDGRSQGGRSIASRRTRYDGPSSRPASPAGGSGSRPGSRSGSPRPGSPSMGERNPATARTGVVDVKFQDLPASAYSIVRGQEDMRRDPRPPPSKLGQEVRVALNTFDAELSNITIYQFDVLVGSGAETRGLVMNVWKSKSVQQALGSNFIFDGNKLAWSLKPLNREIKLLVDLDQEYNRKPRPGKDNKHRIIIKQTNPVQLTTLMAYLNGQCDFDNACLEAITCLNHVLRQTPSTKYTQIKQSFFQRGQQRFNLTGGVEAFKGVFSSMRIVHCGPGLKGRLSINIDVANGTFWTESVVANSAVAITGKRDVNDLIVAVQKNGEDSPAGKQLKKLRGLRVISQHRGGARDQYTIDKLIYKSARILMIIKSDGTTQSVYDYFAKTYNIRLQYPDLPIAKMKKGKQTYLPLELLRIEQNERYAYKLDERQMSNMIKFAVEEPPKRQAAIQHGLSMLDHANDPVLKAFGIRVNSKMTTVPGRLLTAPKVQYGQGTATPGTSGRWDLKAKKFLTPNSAPLKSWAVCVIPGSTRGGKPDRAAIENFIREFCKVYTSHGGKIDNKQPAMALASGADVGTWVTSTWNAAGNQNNMRPQILVFILPDKDSNVYGRIKRSCECRYGVVSQCVQYSHAQKAAPQYLSNVCMKFNAKLGGQSARAVGAKSGGPTGHFSVPTAIIGADVSHAAPGSINASMAAMTISMDKLGIRYAAGADTNGYRVEMISTENIHSILKPLLQTWNSQVGGGAFPKRIIYMRDGVSEAQYSHVIQQEVKDMKDLIKTANPTLDIPFVVIVASKRHHVRFFPEKGDRNSNALPGTLIDSGVTHPFENDFYLCAHNALKGTARPCHYAVILNEPKMSTEELQTMIYEQSYQYVRSTTPISQHPAIYYAHIVSNRAIPHDPKWAGSSDGTPTAAGGAQSGSQSGGKSGGGSSSGIPTEYERLMPMPNQGGIMTSMWYI